MSEKAAPAIELQDVHLSLGRGPARVHILKGVSVSLPDGEASGLVGPSGSGKSTLLMTMAGLERPDSGLVRVAGQDLGKLDEDELAVFRVALGAWDRELSEAHVAGRRPLLPGLRKL